MRLPTKDFRFTGVYKAAAIVEQCVDNPGSFIEINWRDADALRSLVRPSRISLLARYVYSTIFVADHQDFRGNSDMYEEYGAEELHEQLRAYDIAFDLYVPPDEDTDEPYRFYDWFLSQYDSFEELWERETDEAFHLLFGNRSFLLRFNLSLAEYLGSGEVAIPPEYLDGGGRLRRSSSIPVWAKNAVYYRDHGRCVLCQRDLSGLLTMDKALHYDHMVPLKAWGTNDPANLQLLCEGCNLRKAAGDGRTATRYIPWWDY